MINETAIQFLKEAIGRLQNALITHDHPNLALIDHIHTDIIDDSRYNVKYTDTSVNIDLNDNCEYYHIFLTDNNTNINVNSTSNINMKGRTITIIFEQDSTGGFNVNTWDSKIEFLGGGTPSLDPTANSKSIVKLETVDGGTTLVGYNF